MQTQDIKSRLSCLLKPPYGELAVFTVVSIAAGLVFFTRLGDFPLFDPDEALYAEPAREMLETGNYLTTTLNYVVRFTKPPLCIWIMMMSYKLFGINEFAARFFSAACGLILVSCTYWFCRQVFSRQAAFTGALTLLSAPLFVAVGREAITDMPLSCFVAISLMCFFLAFQRRQGGLLVPGYALIGLAIMTKGPVGLLLPLLIIFLYHFLQGNLLTAVAFYRFQFGAILVLIIALPWFLLEIASTHGAYFHDFIMRENLQRFTSVIDHHHGPWFYHLTAVLAGYFPWSVFLPQACWLALSPSFSSIKRMSFSKALSWSVLNDGRKLFRNLSPAQAVLLFSFCTVLVTIVFFSTSVSKLIPYTIPAFPFLAVLISGELEQIFASGVSGRILLPLGVLSMAYGCAGWLGMYVKHTFCRLPVELWHQAALYSSRECLVSVLTVIMVFWFKRPFISLTIFSIFTLVCTGWFGGEVLVVLSRQWQGSIPEFSRIAGASREPIFVYRIRKPSVLFYARRPTVFSPNQERVQPDLNLELPRHRSAYIIVSSGDASQLLNNPGFTVAGDDGRFLLVHWQRAK